MFSFITLGTNDLEKNKIFYNKLLNLIDVVNVEEEDYYVGYAKKTDLKNIEFYLIKPHNKKMASFGNGTMITFTAKSKENVQDFYNLALSFSVN